MSTILIIDDDASFSKLAKYHLEQEGYTVHVSSDGQTGILSAVNLRPNLIILDLKMPRMPGIAVISHLRGDDGKLIFPVLVITAAEDKDYIQDEFMIDGFITKPFEMDVLTKEVKRILGHNVSRAPATEEKKQNTPFQDQSHIKAEAVKFEDDSLEPNAEVMIVEDCEETFKKIDAKFKAENFKVRNIAKGRDAIKELSRKLPPFVLVKYNLPDIKGDEVLGDLKEVIKAESSFIILYTDQPEKDRKRLQLFSTIMANVYGNQTAIRIIETNDPDVLLQQCQKLKEAN